MTGEPPVSTKETLCRAIRAGDVSAFFALMDYLEENPCLIADMSSDYVLLNIKTSREAHLWIRAVLFHVCNVRRGGSRIALSRRIVDAIP